MSKKFYVFRMGLVGMGSGELTEDKLMNQTLEKGRLLEFKKDSERVLLAVAQRPDGKKNWMVFDQVLVKKKNCAPFCLNWLLG